MELEILARTLIGFNRTGAAGLAGLDALCFTSGTRTMSVERTSLPIRHKKQRPVFKLVGIPDAGSADSKIGTSTSWRVRNRTCKAKKASATSKQNAKPTGGRRAIVRHPEKKHIVTSRNACETET